MEPAWPDAAIFDATQWNPRRTQHHSARMGRHGVGSEAAPLNEPRFCQQASPLDADSQDMQGCRLALYLKVRRIWDVSGVCLPLLHLKIQIVGLFSSRCCLQTPLFP
mmetsp:Transcript_48659/g.94034  ORF Transcript_48659/g.94034 Transcript_48659/m.94034 type:complete len:107 (-) Transcript_48659:52-372(-)